MGSLKTSSNDLHFSCSQAVRHFINLPGFQLYAEDEFSQLVYHRCQLENIQGADTVFQNIALNIYAEGLYQAVNSKENLTRQETGFQELSKYLYRLAYNFYLRQAMDINETAEKAQDCTQMALERIYYYLENVRSPGGFLKWCGTILRNICLEDVRGRKIELSLDDEATAKEIPGDSQGFSLESEQERDCLIAAVLRLKEDHQRVICLTFFSWNERGEKMRDEEIAKEMAISTGNLYTIRSRALLALRKDKQLLDCMDVVL